MAKDKTMSNDKTLISIAALLALVALLVAFILWAQTSTPTDKDPTLHYALGEAAIKGYVGADVYYDKEPVDVSIKADNGSVYDSSNADVYEIDKDRKCITILMDTGDLGKWTIGYNLKSNNNVHFSFINKLSSTLYIDTPQLVHNTDGHYYVEFQPIKFVNDLNEDIKYMIDIKSTADETREERISDGYVKYNELAYVLFEPSILAYNGDTYDVIVTLTSNDNQTVTSSFKLKLSELQQNE